MDIEATSGSKNEAPLSLHRRVRERVHEEVTRTATPHSWLTRLPLSGVLAYLLAKHLTDFSYSSLVGGIDLVMHEAGHLFFVWFGSDILTVLGGTLFQILCPLAVGAAFLRQKDYYGISVALFWIGINLAEIAPYVADARTQLLPLVSPFPGAPIHDWGFLLGRAGLLDHDQLVARAFHDAGIVTMAAGLIWGLWILKTMYEARSRISECIAS